MSVTLIPAIKPPTSALINKLITTFNLHKQSTIISTTAITTAFITKAQLLYYVIELKYHEIYNNNCLSNCQSYLDRSEEHTSELQSRFDLVCLLLLVLKN